MKLLYCPHCQDVRKLAMASTFPEKEEHQCQCGRSWGYYTDDINAVYGGAAVMLGIASGSLADGLDAAKNKPLGVQLYPGGPFIGVTFEAFIIPESAPTVRREK